MNASSHLLKKCFIQINTKTNLQATQQQRKKERKTPIGKVSLKTQPSRVRRLQYLVVAVIQLLEIGSNLLLQLLGLGVEALHLLLPDVQLAMTARLEFTNMYVF